MSAVLCLGEIVLDMIRNAPKPPLWTGSDFENHPAGVPANVAVGVARQGVSASLIGRVGCDTWGGWLKYWPVLLVLT